MSEDRELWEAVAAARAVHADTSSDPFSTQDRVLTTLARRSRVRRRLVTALTVVALSFTGTTAWAWATGNLPAPVERLLGIEAAEPPPAREPPARTEQRPRGVAPVGPAAEPAVDLAAPETAGNEAAVSEPGHAPAATVDLGPARAATRPSRRAHPASGAPEPSEAPAAPDPERARRLADYRAAHEAHFRDRDPTRALGLWDAFLSSWPNAELAPEARYNRALTLVRLGRHAEASEALRPFAEGAHGGYRQEEARRLIEALSR